MSAQDGKPGWHHPSKNWSTDGRPSLSRFSRLFAHHRILGKAFGKIAISRLSLGRGKIGRMSNVDVSVCMPYAVCVNEWMNEWTNERTNNYEWTIVKCSIVLVIFTYIEQVTYTWTWTILWEDIHIYISTYLHTYTQRNQNIIHWIKWSIIYLPTLVLFNYYYLLPFYIIFLQYS